MAFRLLNSLRLLAAGAPFPSLYDSVAVKTIRGPALIVSRRLADSYAAGGGGGSGSASGSQQHQSKNANQDIPVQSSDQGGQGQRGSQEQNQDSNRSATSSSSSTSTSGAGSAVSGSRGSQHWPDTELLKADRAGRRRHPAYFRGFEDDWDWNLPSPSSFFSELNNAFPWGSEANPARQRQGRMTYFQPKVDIADEGQTLVFHAEVPGMSQKDLKVEITEDRLRLSGEKSEEKMEKEKNWTRQERTKGYFTREFPLPRGVDPSQISAKLKDGVLEIRVPKPVQITTHAVNIE